MFEKDAEEYAGKGGLPKEKYLYGLKALSFKDGAEFGYNKGFKEGLKQKVNITTISDYPIKDEWHYVKDGDLPPKKKLDIGTKSESVYVATRGCGTYIGYYNFSRKVWYLADNDYQEINEVYAWCELPVPPKDVEE